MIRALYTAASGMMASQLAVDTIANNVANVNTLGFRASRVEPTDLAPVETAFAAGLRRASEYVPTSPPLLASPVLALAAFGPDGGVAAPVGQGVWAGVQRLFTPGPLTETGQPLDLAIAGDGFFQVLLPDGRIGYTRDGSFRLDGDGQLVTASGYPLLFDGPAPSGLRDPEEVAFGPGGRVTVTPRDGSAASTYTLSLARFANPGGLLGLGGGVFVETAASGPTAVGVPGSGDFGSVRSGWLEGSNVQLADELTRLISAQRAYQLNARALQTADDMLGLATNIRR